MMSGRQRDGTIIHDGALRPPDRICPRERTDCTPLSRVASPNFASFMCCGETDAAPVPTDRLRLCVKSTHDNKPVDVIVNFDERDAIDTSYVLLGGLSAFAQDRESAAYAAKAQLSNSDYAAVPSQEGAPQSEKSDAGGSP